MVRLLRPGTAPTGSQTSAGSIVGAILAAAAGTGEVGPEKIRDLAMSIDYRKFLDPGLLGTCSATGPAWAILEGKGVYKGDYAHDFVAGRLSELGVTTFGDLRLDDGELPERRYRLVVTVTDVTRGQLVRLPWTIAASTDWTPTSSPLPTRCGRRCRPVSVPAGHPDQLGRTESTWWTADCCRTTRSTPSTGSTESRRAGRPSASLCCRICQPATTSSSRAGAGAPLQRPRLLEQVLTTCSSAATRPTSTSLGQRPHHPGGLHR